MNLGIFLPNWIGDVVMATPTLRALRKQFPDARLIGVMRPYVAEVLAGTPWLDEMVLHHHQSSDPKHRTLNVLASLRRRQLDQAVLLTNSWRTAILAFFSGAKQRIGYGRDGRGWLLTRQLDPLMLDGRRAPSPVLDYYLELAYALGCPLESPRMELATSALDEAAADRVWNKLHLPRDRRVVAFNSSGAFGAAKLWPSEYFAQLARRVADELGHSVLVVCGPGEKPIARQIVAEARHARVVSLADEEVGIGLTKACISRSELLVSTDSGPRHFAAAFDVPVVTLFGPTNQAWSENHYAGAVHVQLKLDCSPCQQRVCPLKHHRCMRDLTVEQVFQAVAAQFDRGRAAHAA